MDRQPVRGCSTAAARAHEVRSAAISVARSVRVEGLAGPAEAYVVIGSLDMMTKTAEDVMTSVAGWLRAAQQEGRLTVREGPFAGEPDAAVAVVADALARASTACAHAHAQLERAHIAAADIGALAHPNRPSSRRS